MATASLRASGIYAIRNTINGKRYVGSAVYLARRWSAHKHELARGIHHTAKLQAAWKKHGAAAFVFEILELVSDVTQLIDREQHWMDHFQVAGPGGYNMKASAFSSLGHKMSEEFKAARSKAYKGRTLPPEQRRKIGESLTGRIHSEATRQKISAALTGRKKPPMSDETKAKMSAARTGVKRGPMSEEQRQKLSVVHTGRKSGPPSEETRRKISAAKIEGFKRRRELQAQSPATT